MAWAKEQYGKQEKKVKCRGGGGGVTQKIAWKKKEKDEKEKEGRIWRE